MRYEANSVQIVRVRSTGVLAQLLVLLAMAVASRAAGQMSCDIGPMPEGSWSGVFNLDEMYPQREIALAAVLPPPMDPNQLGAMRVLFACRTNCAQAYPAPAVQTRSYVWSPRDPDEATVLDVDVAPADLVGDIFCSGLTFDANGDLWTAGGLNYPDKCAGNSCDVGSQPDLWLAVGHRYTFRLDTSSALLDWVAGPQLNIERWYPTMVAMDNGDLLVAGHENQPSPTCPAPYTSSTYPLGTAFVGQVRETINAAGSTVSPLSYNNLLVAPCGLGAGIGLSEYPRLHLGRNQRVFWTNGMSLNQGGDLVSRLYSMDVNPATACNPPLWLSDSTDQLRGHINGGGSVQLIYRDDPPQTGTHEVLYLVGGATESEDEPCDALDAIKADVLKAVDPGAATSWVAAPPLTEPRVNHNTVILANGELLVVGGGGNADCVDAHQVALNYPEIYRPPEIFPGEGTAWQPLYSAQSEAPHLYHSVAGLLLDGRVFVAGTAGQNLYFAYYYVEIFSPWYYFSSNRPVIEAWPKPTDVGAAGLVQYGQTFDITVSAPCLVDRVVLLRSGAMTHAFDMSQRYVELDYTKISGSAVHPTLRVTSPPNGFTAPPGFYMLAVVDDTNVPSKARWVRVGEQ